MKGIEDYFFMCELICREKEIGFLEEQLVYYRQHNNAISSNKIDMIKLRWNTYMIKKKIFQSHQIKLSNRLFGEFIYLLNQIKTFL